MIADGYVRVDYVGVRGLHCRRCLNTTWVQADVRDLFCPVCGDYHDPAATRQQALAEGAPEREKARRPGAEGTAGLLV